MDDAPRFEDALRRLEQAVEALEGGELGLDEALAHYEEGVRLLGRCKALLDHAVRRVSILNGTDAEGNPVADSFDDPESVDRAAGSE